MVDESKVVRTGLSDEEEGMTTEELKKYLDQKQETITIGEGIETLDFNSDEEMNHALEKVNRRNIFMKKAKELAIKEALLPTDFHDENGKPLLQGVGCQRLLLFFGITITDIKRHPIKGYEIVDQDTEGRLRVSYTADFKLGNVSIPAEGMRDTHNNLLCRAEGKYKNIADIELPDLDRSARTALYRDGVTTLLGLKGITWQYLDQFGFTPDKTTGHTYDKTKKELSDEEKAQQKEIADWIFEMAGTDKKIAGEMSIAYTYFITDDGKQIKGKVVKYWSGAQIHRFYNKVKSDYDEFIKNMNKR